MSQKRVLAQVVGAVLERVRKSDPAGRLTASVHLASNRLQGVAGIGAVLGSVAEAGLRVSRLDLEWNRLGWDAAVWLARWCHKQPGGPPEELYLSHNKLGDQALSGLLRVLGPLRNASASTEPPAAPLWVEARANKVRDVDALLNEVSRTVRLCLAQDPRPWTHHSCWVRRSTRLHFHVARKIALQRSHESVAVIGFAGLPQDRGVCGPESCASCRSVRHASEAPQLHLFGILDQDRLFCFPSLSLSLRMNNSTAKFVYSTQPTHD